jgi:hypothetical protein
VRNVKIIKNKGHAYINGTQAINVYLWLYLNEYIHKHWPMWVGFPHHRGKVLFLSWPMRLMVVEQGTASRWWELLGSVGTHWLFLFTFCSLRWTEKWGHLRM